MAGETAAADIGDVSLDPQLALVQSPRAASGGLEGQHSETKAPTCKKELLAMRKNILIFHFPGVKTEQKILLLDIELSGRNHDATASTSHCSASGN